MNNYLDREQLVQQRLALVKRIRAKGIDDERVLDAIGKVPRHNFMPHGMQDKAYIDKAFPIGEQQTISQPYTVAYQTELLKVMPGQKILEIGTGSAYQAAVLAEMGADVYTIERQKKLYDRNRTFVYLKKYSNLHCCYGDGYKGWPKEAPFDRILITAAPESVPFELISQLRPGGMLVAPVGRSGAQRMIRLTLDKNGNLIKEMFDNFSFVPMLRGREL